MIAMASNGHFLTQMPQPIGRGQTKKRCVVSVSEASTTLICESLSVPFHALTDAQRLRDEGNLALRVGFNTKLA
jgi:hypothetical protein